MSKEVLLYLVPAAGIFGLLFTAVRSAWVTRQDTGNDRMREIAKYIADGSMAFLKAEYKILTYFVIIAAVLLAVMGNSNHENHWSIGIAFVIGAFLSALAGFLGNALGWYRPGQGASFIAAIVGAVIILFVYRLIARRR